MKKSLRVYITINRHNQTDSFPFRNSIGFYNKKNMAKPKEARALMEQFYKSNADIKVAHQKNILQVCIHHQATVCEDIILTKLCEYLNKTETIFTGSDLKLQYCLI